MTRAHNGDEQHQHNVTTCHDWAILCAAPTPRYWTVVQHLGSSEITWCGGAVSGRGDRVVAIQVGTATNDDLWIWAGPGCGSTSARNSQSQKGRRLDSPVLMRDRQQRRARS